MELVRFTAHVRHWNPEKQRGLAVADVPSEHIATLGGLRQLLCDDENVPIRIGEDRARAQRVPRQRHGVVVRCFVLERRAC